MQVFILPARKNNQKKENVLPPLDRNTAGDVKGRLTQTLP